MPITAKLSKQFYDRLGNDVANELADWLNAVDTSYRQEFRELFEAHFGRLTADMRELETRMESRMARLVTELRFETDRKLDVLRADVGTLRVELANRDKSLIRWMFGFWIGSWAMTAGTMVALWQLSRLFAR